MAKRDQIDIEEYIERERLRGYQAAADCAAPMLDALAYALKMDAELPIDNRLRIEARAAYWAAFREAVLEVMSDFDLNYRDTS